MEEEKAAAYYDELTRKGEGAARFKQGLGFSSGANSSPSRGSALPSSASSFLSTFVKASASASDPAPEETSRHEKQWQLETIQNKLKKKSRETSSSRVSERSSRESSRRHRSRSRERHYSRRSRSRSRERYGERQRDRSRERSRRRSRSWSRSPRRGHRSERRSRSRSRSLPRERRRSEKSISDNGDRKRVGKEKNGGVDYSQLIQGYDKMTPAERVKAKMKLQLDETAGKDEGMGSGWERFEFNKDAPLDDEETEVVEDDAALVKKIGQSFRFSAVQARREEQIQVAHDEAMFGAPSVPSSVSLDSEPQEDIKKSENTEANVAASLLSEKVLAKQQGSWRDRARKG